MTNALKQAIEKVSELPLAAQERIGEELLLHVEKFAGCVLNSKAPLIRSITMADAS